MSYYNRGWGPTGYCGRDRGETFAAPSIDIRGRGRGEMRAASNIDTYTNAPGTLKAARGNSMISAATAPALTSLLGLFHDRFGRSRTRTESTGNVANEQATTPDVSNEVWARAVAATQSSSPPTSNIGEQTRDESSLFSSAGPVVVAIPAAVDQPLQSAIPTSSTALPLPNTRLLKPAATGSPSVQPPSSTPQASMLVKRLAGRSRLQL
jgi:hypothetical protein